LPSILAIELFNEVLNKGESFTSPGGEAIAAALSTIAARKIKMSFFMIFPLGNC
jgi:hypothetical protein